MTKKKAKSKKTTARAKSKPKPAKMKVVKPEPPEKLRFKIEMDAENTHINAEGNMEIIARNLAGLIVRYPKLLTIFEDAVCLVKHQDFIEKEYLRTKKQNNESTK